MCLIMIYTHIHIYIYTYTYVYICVHTYLSIYLSLSLSIYIYIYDMHTGARHSVQWVWRHDTQLAAAVTLRFAAVAVSRLLDAISWNCQSLRSRYSRWLTVQARRAPTAKHTAFASRDGQSYCDADACRTAFLQINIARRRDALHLPWLQ